MKKLESVSVFLVCSALLILSCNTGGMPEISVRSPRLIGTEDLAVFMLIVNDGTGSDILTGYSLKEFPAARVELHDVKNGKMTKIQTLKIPAHEIVSLKRGSIHIMLFDLPVEQEKELTLVLQFEKSGTIEVNLATND